MATRAFADRLAAAVVERRSQLVVGLDPRLDLLPLELRGDAHTGREAAATAYSRFCRGLIDATCPYAVAVKPQSAFFEALGADGVRAFEDVCEYARTAGLLVIGDLKRGDIGSTARAYAAAYLEPHGAEEPLVDAMTVSAYLGRDSLEPFVAECRRSGRGIFCLVKTSNPGGVDVQDLKLTDGSLVWHQVAKPRRRARRGRRRRVRALEHRRRRRRDLSARGQRRAPAAPAGRPAPPRRSARRARPRPTSPARSRAARPARSSASRGRSTTRSAGTAPTGGPPPPPRRPGSATRSGGHPAGEHEGPLRPRRRRRARARLDGARGTARRRARLSRRQRERRHAAPAERRRSRADRQHHEADDRPRHARAREARRRRDRGRAGRRGRASRRSSSRPGSG